MFLPTRKKTGKHLHGKGNQYTFAVYPPTITLYKHKECVGKIKGTGIPACRKQHGYERRAQTVRKVHERETTKHTAL